MNLKTLTWNIGGGKVLAPGADPSLMASYAVDGLEQIIAFLKQEQPDIITLQETEKGPDGDQVALIADALGYAYYIHDSTSESHIDTDSQLGHGIISRFPIRHHEFGWFYNPHVKVMWEDGRTVSTFDKGYTNVVVEYEGEELQVSTLYLVPFRRFAIDLESDLGKTILEDIETHVTASTDRFLIQGDFNIDTKELRPFLPHLFEGGAQEVVTPEATTPNHHTYDHIIYKGLIHQTSRVDRTIQTDHYPVMATFKV